MALWSWQHYVSPWVFVNGAKQGTENGFHRGFGFTVDLVVTTVGASVKINGAGHHHILPLLLLSLLKCFSSFWHCWFDGSVFWHCLLWRRQAQQLPNKSTADQFSLHSNKMRSIQWWARTIPFKSDGMNEFFPRWYFSNVKRSSWFNCGPNSVAPKSAVQIWSVRVTQLLLQVYYCRLTYFH